MTRTTTLLGAALFFLGLGAYAYVLTTDNASVTALIPAFFGVSLLALGLAATKWPKRNATFIHFAALLVLLGLVGTLRGLTSLPKFFTAPDEIARPVAVIVQSAMALLCLAYLVLTIRSFFNARQASKSD